MSRVLQKAFLREQVMVHNEQLEELYEPHLISIVERTSVISAQTKTKKL